MAVHDSRAGLWSSQQARQLHVDFLREHWLAFAKVCLLFWLGAAAAFLFMPDPIRPYVVGAVVASPLWLIAMFAVQFAGSSGHLLGAQGEIWTSEALRKLR